MRTIARLDIKNNYVIKGINFEGLRKIGNPVELSAKYYAFTNTGFKPNTERTSGTYSKYSSFDDKIDDFHYYTTYIKFGLGRASYDSAQEIRCGKITREEALSLVKKYDHEFPKKHFKNFLDYVNIKEDEFWKIIDSYRSPHLWEKENNNWKIKHTVF